MKVWIDGELFDGDRARVPVTDHGLLYGDGVFEGIRAYGGRLFRLEAHLARLSHGARALHLSLPGGLPRLREAVEQTLAAHGEPEAYVRLLVTRGDGPLGVDPNNCPRPRILCLADGLSLFPEDKRRRGLDLVTSSLRRPPSDVLDPRVKSLNYLNNVLAKAEARRQGADEALLLNAHGHIAEASVANLFVVRGRTLATPPTTDGALDGITRAAVRELAGELGVPWVERSLGRMDLIGADEAFLTGTGAGIVRIASLDGEPVGRGEPGPVTTRLTDAYEALARRGHEGVR